MSELRFDSTLSNTKRLTGLDEDIRHRRFRRHFCLRRGRPRHEPGSWWPAPRSRPPSTQGVPDLQGRGSLPAPVVNIIQSQDFCFSKKFATKNLVIAIWNFKWLFRPWKILKIRENDQFLVIVIFRVTLLFFCYVKLRSLAPKSCFLWAFQASALDGSVTSLWSLRSNR